MSIDYDRLRDLVRIAGGGRRVRDYATEHDAERDLENLAPDLARELLRLRDGVEVIRNRCATLAKSAQAAGIHTLANEMDINAKALTGLLEGDTK